MSRRSRRQRHKNSQPGQKTGAMVPDPAAAHPEPDPPKRLPAPAPSAPVTPLEKFFKNGYVANILSSLVILIATWLGTHRFGLTTKQQVQILIPLFVLMIVLALIDRFLLKPIARTHPKHANGLLVLHAGHLAIIGALAICLGGYYNQVKFARIRAAATPDAQEAAKAQGRVVYALLDSLRSEYSLKHADVTRLDIAFVLIGPHGAKDQRIAGRYDRAFTKGGFGRVRAVAGSEHALAGNPDRMISVDARGPKGVGRMACSKTVSRCAARGIDAVICSADVPLRRDGAFDVNLQFCWPDAVPNPTDIFFADLLAFPRLQTEVTLRLYSDVPVAPCAWLLQNQGGQITFVPLDPERFVTSNISIPSDKFRRGARHVYELTIRRDELQSVVMLEYMRNPGAIAS